MAVPDWVKIWFLASSAASAAKSASLMVDMLAAVFWILFIRLDEVNSKRFCLAPISDLAVFTASIIRSKLPIEV